MSVGLDGTTTLNTALDEAVASEGNSSQINGGGGDSVAGGLSNLLVAEAGHALGLKGFAGVAFSSIGGSITTQLVHNLGTILLSPNGLTGATETSLFSGFDAGSIGTDIANLAGAVGAYFGSELVPPHGLTGQIGASVGTSVGILIGTSAAVTGSTIGASLGSVVPVIGTLIGAFVGDIVGTLIGNLFGSNAPPRDQTIAAQVGATFGIVYQDSAHGGWSGQFTDYATGIDTAAGALVSATGGTLSGISGIGNLQFYSNGGDTHVRLVNGQLDGLSPDPATYTQAAKDSVLSLAKNAAITGGDAIMTAAFAAATRQDKTIEAFGQDLQVAMDYKTYLANTEAINLAMAASPDSAFTAGWDITLLRAQELGLNQVGDAAGWTAALTTDGTRSVETVKDNNGIVVEQENFAADGSQVDYQYYLNQTVTLSGKTIKVINGATYNVIGSNNTIQSGHDATLNVTGNQNAVTVEGDNTSVAFHGAGNTVTIVNGAVTADANNDLVVSGNNVVVTGKTGAQITLSGDLFDATVTNGSITLLGSASAYVSGTGNRVTAGTGALVVIGDNSNVAVSDNAIILVEDNTTTIVVGNANTIVGGTSVKISSVGDRNTLSAGNDSFFGITGHDVVAMLDNGNVGLGTDTSLSVFGSSNGIVAGANDSLTLRGDTNRLSAGDATTIVVTGNGNQAALSYGDSVSVNGTGNLLTAAAPTTQAVQVARLYYGLLDRAPDPSGSGNFTASATQGASLASIAQGILGSVEYHAKYGALSDDQFVRALWANALGRTNEYSGWVDALGRGLSRADAAVGIAESLEASLRLDVGIQTLEQTVSASLSGHGNTAVLSNSSVMVTNGSSAKINGDSNTIAGGLASNLNIVGNNDTTTVGDGSTVAVTGKSDVTTAGSNAMLTVSGDIYNSSAVGAHSTVVQNSSIARITAGDGSTVSVNSIYDTVNVGASSRLTDSGGWNTDTLGNNATVAINSSYDTVTVGDGSTIAVMGKSDVTTAGANAMLTVSGDIYNSSTVGAHSTVVQNSSIARITAGDGSTVSVNSIYDTVNVGAWSTLTDSGGWNTDTLGNNATVAINSSYDTVTVGDGSTVAVTGKSDVTTAGANAMLTVSGDIYNSSTVGAHSTVVQNSSIARITAGDGSTVSVNGIYDTVNVGAWSTLTDSGGWNTDTLGNNVCFGLQQ